MPFQGTATRSFPFKFQMIWVDPASYVIPSNSGAIPPFKQLGTGDTTFQMDIQKLPDTNVGALPAIYVLAGDSDAIPPFQIASYNDNNDRDHDNNEADEDDD